jgi:hypothetical protein
MVMSCVNFCGCIENSSRSSFDIYSSHLSQSLRSRFLCDTDKAEGLSGVSWRPRNTAVSWQQTKTISITSRSTANPFSLFLALSLRHLQPTSFWGSSVSLQRGAATFLYNRFAQSASPSGAFEILSSPVRQGTPRHCPDQ